jgi:hypothetical protein
MKAREIRANTALVLGSPSGRFPHGDVRWETLRSLMRSQGCVPEERDVAPVPQRPQMRRGWLAPDGSWVACDSAR